MNGGALDPSDAVRCFGQLLAYDDWANREALVSLTAATDPPPLAVALLAHIVAAQNLWLERMRPMGSAVPVWPGTPLPKLEGALAAVRDRWVAFVAALTSSRLADTIVYVNSKGEPWENRVADILMHVVVHGGYHRGQIAALLRGHGAQPAYTDYIHCVRTGQLPEPSTGVAE